MRGMDWGCKSQPNSAPASAVALSLSFHILVCYYSHVARQTIIFLTLLTLDFSISQPRQDIENIFMRTMAGSMMAGVAAGYLSHVPHNISTMKLLNPSLTYSQVGGLMVVVFLYCTTLKGFLLLLS